MYVYIYIHSVGRGRDSIVVECSASDLVAAGSTPGAGRLCFHVATLGKLFTSVNPALSLSRPRVTPYCACAKGTLTE